MDNKAIASKLVGYGELNADTFAPGPSSGNFIETDNRPTPFNSQPVQGFSGVQYIDGESYWFLADNGYGTKDNSADFLLRIYKVDPNFSTETNGSGDAQWTDLIQLSDPDNLVPFEIVNEGTSDRILTGADFDPESIVLADDGTIWIGEEFGPYLLHFNGEGELIDSPIATPNIANINTLNEEAPEVIAHRGASGSRPEHTLSEMGPAAYNLGVDQEADFIEPDLVPTKDGVLIARHENALASVETDEDGEPVRDENGDFVIKEATTNVAELPFFSDRLTTKEIDGKEITGWFSEDFTLSEIKILRAKERIPEIRPQNTFYDYLYEIPTLSEIIEYVEAEEEATGKQINIYPETKHPTYFEGIDLDTSEILIDTLVANDFTDPERVIIQSFEINNLKRLDETIMPEAGVDIPLVQLIESSGAPYDQVVEGSGITYDDMVTPKGLEDIAEYAVGIGPSKNRVIPLNTVDENGDGEADDINGDGQISDADRFAEEPTTLIDDAHNQGLTVDPFTFRSDDFYLPASYENPQEEYEAFFRLGTDGYFSDFPAQARTAVERATGDEVLSPQNPKVLTGNAAANLDSSGGFEGLGYSPDRATLYPMLEKTVFGDPEGALRIYEFDVASQSFADELAGYYQLEDPNYFIGDLTPINDNEFLVIERDGGQGETAEFKKIYKIDLADKDANDYISKELVVDLLNIEDPNDLNDDGETTFDFPFETIENVIVLDKNTILVANDNNYPFSTGRDPNPDIDPAIIDNNEIILLELPESLDLDPHLPVPPEPVRVATFNAALNRSTEGQLIEDLSTGEQQQPKNVAEIIQRVAPEVLLINEFDYNSERPVIAPNLFLSNYLEEEQFPGVDPITYEYFYVAPSNTGVPSGFDLNRDGKIVTEPETEGYAEDAWGFGDFEGQYGMVFYSQYEILRSEIRTFRDFLWKDMPGARLPDDPDTPEPGDWYSPEILEEFPLSSKSHWDIPILVDGEVIHILASHPTPPTFDGEEDRNGLRNSDEIRFWADYVTPGAGDYIYDDDGNYGGLEPGSRFMILGDQNADPFDGDSTPPAINQLLDNPNIQGSATDASITPFSAGGVDAAIRQGGANSDHVGNPAYDTADFNDNNSGNLRADYVLPSVDLEIEDKGVYWLTKDDPNFERLIGDFNPTLDRDEFPEGFLSSDHRLVYVDII